jgi:hypothetical protein
VGNFKRKAMGEGVKKDDTSQTLVVAKQVRNIVETYFTNNPKALKDAKTIPLHVYLNSVFIVESIFEVQNDHGRTFAKYVLSESVQRVAVDDLFFTRHGESVVDLQTRDLKAALELEFAASKKQVLEIRRLKSELEVMDNMREQLERSKNDEQLALQETSECRKEIQALKHQIYWIRRSDRGAAQEDGGVAAAAGELERSLELRLNTQGTSHPFFLIQSMC